MSKLLTKAKVLGKNYYFYLTLYWIGVIGTSLITIFRYDMIDKVLVFNNWIDAFLLLGIIWSIPILGYTVIQTASRAWAIFVSGISFVIILIIFGISTAGAEAFVDVIKTALLPFLCFFILYKGIYIGIKGGQKIKSK